VPTVDRSKATVMAKIRFVDSDPRILPEMSAKVAFLAREMPPGERAPRTVVQPAAIVTRNGRTEVFVVKGDRATAVEIRTGAKIGEMIEVVSGVSPGERVVVRPPRALRDGSKVSLPAK